MPVQTYMTAPGWTHVHSISNAAGVACGAGCTTPANHPTPATVTEGPVVV